MNKTTTTYEADLRKRAKDLDREIAADKAGAHAVLVENLERQYAGALDRAGLDGHRADGEAAQIGAQLSRTRGQLSSLMEAQAELRTERDRIARLLTGAERNAAALAEEVKCTAKAGSEQQMVDRFEATIVSFVARQAQAVIDAEAQDALFIRNVEEGLGDAGEPTSIEQLARPLAGALADSIPKLRAEQQKHVDACDAALRAAEGWRQAALEAEADRLELEFAGVMTAVVGPLAAFVKAYRAAHSDAPPLPDLQALALRGDAANDAEGGEPVKGGLLRLFRRL